MEAKVRSTSDQIQIFDRIRKKFVQLTPEEWVRQHLISNLIVRYNVIESRIMVESEIKYGKVKKRPDIAVINADGSTWLILECKAASVTLDQSTWQQTFTYGSVLKPSFMGISNGLQHIFAGLQPETENFVFMNELPNYTI